MEESYNEDCYEKCIVGGMSCDEGMYICNGKFFLLQGEYDEKKKHVDKSLP